MNTTTPDQVLVFTEDIFANLVLDQENPADRFVPIYLGREEITSVDLDRRFVLTMGRGPELTGGSSCTEEIGYEGCWRYYTERTSRSRMVRDVRVIRRTFRKLAQVSTAGLKPEVAAVQTALRRTTIDAVEYDYSAVLGLTLVTFAVRQEYHIDVMAL